MNIGKYSPSRRARQASPRNAGNTMMAKLGNNEGKEQRKDEMDEISPPAQPFRS